MHNQATIHPLVLAAVTVLTVCSVVAMASVSSPALLSAQGHGASQPAHITQTVEQLAAASSQASADDTGSEEFESVVRPTLSSCFNCGEVIAIETIGNISADDLQFELRLHEAYNGAHASSLIRDSGTEAASKDTPDEGSYEPQDNLFAPPGSEQPSESKVTYLIKVRMQNGTQHTITQNTPPEQTVGDKIRISSGKLIAT